MEKDFKIIGDTCFHCKCDFDRPTLSSSQTCKYLGVCKKTLINWYRSGKLVPGFVHPLTGVKKYSKTQLNDFMRANSGKKRMAVRGFSRKKKE